MSPLGFCFVLHIHQPVGNFEHVFREHADDVYRPFLDFLERRDVFPIGLHVSGPLLEWMEAHDVRLLDRIGRLVEAGRIELLAAGWYEPILAAIPRPDRATQIGWMRDALRVRFGVEATGLWLTERVWKPALVPDLVDAGIAYALVDDHLAIRGGLGRDRLGGPLRVEQDGRSVNLLAIDEGLRYLIPFRPAGEVEAELRGRHEAGDRLALFGDDGEKFGGWPRTREWLYDDGWLEAFGDVLDRLRSDGTIELVTPGSIGAGDTPAEAVELPAGSYPEMDEWSGGDWDNFLVRYSEAGRTAARMRALSALCRRRGDPESVRRAVGRGQCNDAYWHGVFGGVYMKHLREGVRLELAGAERALRRGERLDCEAVAAPAHDGDCWWVHSDRFAAWVEARGGLRIIELTHFGSDPDLTDTLTRRVEGYHLEAVARVDVSRQETGAAPSIHETEERATLDRLPAADLEDRTLLIDRVLPGNLDLGAYIDSAYRPLWTWPDEPVEGPNRIAGALEWRCATTDARRVRKWLRLDAAGSVEVEWTWDPDAFPVGALFAPELSLGREAEPRLEPPTEVWRFPIVTVSKCPDGFEEIEQGTSLTPRWPVRLGRARLVLGPEPDSAHR